jgi:hypothetical protein
MNSGLRRAHFATPPQHLSERNSCAHPNASGSCRDRTHALQQIGSLFNHFVGASEPEPSGSYLNGIQGSGAPLERDRILVIAVERSSGFIATRYRCG